MINDFHKRDNEACLGESTSCECILFGRHPSLDTYCIHHSKQHNLNRLLDLIFENAYDLIFERIQYQRVFVFETNRVRY